MAEGLIAPWVKACQELEARVKKTWSSKDSA
jgi:hypothetical protein